jgi:P27 family predicted phage terminase small subunit
LSRYPDHPALQAAKGHPGKRRTRVERQLADAKRLAEELAAAPADPNQPLAPPAFIDDPRCAPALAAWREYAPQLDRLNLLHELDRLTFATFCVYVGEFVEANDAIKTKGYSQKVKTIAGGYMLRKTPDVDRRDTAMSYIFDFAERFGFTPLDRAKLFRDHRALPEAVRSLFNHHNPEQSPQETAPTQPPPPADALGAMDSFDSAPPSGLPN